MCSNLETHSLGLVAKYGTVIGLALNVESAHTHILSTAALEVES